MSCDMHSKDGDITSFVAPLKLLLSTKGLFLFLVRMWISFSRGPSTHTPDSCNIAVLSSYISVYLWSIVLSIPRTS